MSELRELMDRELPRVWEAEGASADVAIRHGTRLRRRRRFTATVAAAGCLLTVVGLAVGAVASLPRDAPPASDAPTTVTLPELDPDEFYYWDSDSDSVTYGPDDSLTEPYAAALSEFLGDPDAGPLNVGQRVDFTRFGRQLFHDRDGDFRGGPVDDEVVHEQPYYYSAFELPTGGTVFVDVVPSGGFTPGATEDLRWQGDDEFTGTGDAVTHLIGCGDLRDDNGSGDFGSFTADCESTTGPDEQPVIRGVETFVADGETQRRGRVVLYRPDGTAVSVRFADEAKPEDIPPLLTAMTELAAALPDDPVR